jgi:beta-1,4-N-acetylglucosaminyltransferase
MKVALVCSHGGHLTEILHLLEAFEGDEIVLITYRSMRTSELTYKKYLLENIYWNPVKMVKAFSTFFSIYRKERPDLIVSTGSEIAIPAFYTAKLFRIPTVFIESWCRVRTTSGTGKIIYPIADLFLVQWPQLAALYGKKAQYAGALI